MRRQLLAKAAIAAYLVLRRRGLLVRLSHSVIADWMARRSSSGIPADLSASASGQPVRRRCFVGAEDLGLGRRAIIADATTLRMLPSQPRALSRIHAPRV
jgi:hypothetical protein